MDSSRPNSSIGGSETLPLSLSAPPVRGLGGDDAKRGSSAPGEPSAVSIRVRIVEIAFVIAAAITVATLAGGWLLLRGQFLEESERTARSVAQLTTEELSGPLSRNSKVEVGKILEQLFQLDDAIFAMVTLPDGTIYLHMGDMPQDPTGVGETKGARIDRRGGTLTVHMPVLDQTRRPVGTLHLGYSLVRIDHRLVGGVLRLFLACVAIAALALVATHLRTRHVIAPLEELASALRQVGRGETAPKLSTPHRDEVGRAIEAFNGVTAYLGELKSGIEREREELETIVRDRTEELRVKHHALGLQNEQIREVSRLKSDFLANMSHELRTPLNAILALSELLRDEITGPLPNPEQRKQAAMIHQSGENLLRLINDVLDLSKIEAGRLEIQYQATELSRLLEGAVEELRPLAMQKGLEIRLHAHAPDALWVDPHRLRQIILNLIGNAIKFTDRGGVDISARAQADTEQLVIHIADTGVGIAPQDHEEIFHEFRQLEGSATRRHGGTGLGLAISRRLARLMGGNIRIKSDLGQGSVFTIEIPAFREMPASPPAVSAELTAEISRERAPALPESSAALGAAGKSERFPAGRGADRLPCVLVADADPFEREALMSGLSRRGYVVHQTRSGDEVLKQLDRIKPDLLVLDLDLAGTAGFELLDHLSRSRGVPQIPILVQTARDLSREEWSSLEGRVEHIFHKNNGGVRLLCDEIQRLVETLRGEPEGTDGSWNRDHAA